MILSAGLSPAWQQTIVLDHLETGEVNRAREVHWCASGKVLNVGLALWRLGSIFPTKIQSRTLALVGGLTGEAICREFAAHELAARWVRSASTTRVCTTILDQETGASTELVENASGIDAAELECFREAYLDEARHAELVVLTGSLPAGTPAGFYRELIEQTQGRVLLDCQGAPLWEALSARPLVIKPNREELGRTLGKPVESDDELRQGMRALNNLGAQWVVVSQGKRQVWISSATRLLAIEPPVLTAVNPIGSGDCLAAGIAMGLACGYDLPAAVRWGVAAAAENVRHILPARFDPAAVKSRFDDLVVREL